ncbi:MAG: hypothetical protein AABY16_04740 [Nanoarchaeota archaeon]
MREDIIGMLKNAMERGGRPEQVARSLINSGYNAMEVQQALSFVTGGTLSSLNAPQQQVNVRPITSQIPMPQQMPAQQMPYPQAPQMQYPQQYARPLPAMRQQYSGPGAGKLILLIFVLLLLLGGLISAVIFKDRILDFFG